MNVRSPYNYDGDVVSHQSGLDCSDSPSRTQQHFRDECDINVMVARFQRTGLPAPSPFPAGVVDFSQAFDFQSAMQMIIDSKRSFGKLPSSIRERFLNDPGRFLAFVGDEANRDEAIRLGLIEKPAPLADVAPVDKPVDSSE